MMQKPVKGTAILYAKVLYQEVYVPLRDLANRNGTTISGEIAHALLKHLGWKPEDIEAYLQDRPSFRRNYKRIYSAEPSQIMKSIPQELKNGRYF